MTTTAAKKATFTITETQQAYGSCDQVFMAVIETLKEEEREQRGFSHCALLSSGQIAKFSKMRFPDALLVVTESCQFSGKDNAGVIYFNN